MTHATVNVSGYVVPLIGIPPTATEEECDYEQCHDLYPLQQIKISYDGRFYCPKHIDHERET
jgi:hypothetical protein